MSVGSKATSPQGIQSREIIISVVSEGGQEYQFLNPTATSQVDATLFIKKKPNFTVFYRYIIIHNLTSLTLHSLLVVCSCMRRFVPSFPRRDLPPTY